MAVIYGVILKAKIVKLLKAPPENRSNSERSPVPPWKIWLNTSLLMPGTGMLAPILKTNSIKRVKTIFFLMSGIPQASLTVFIIPILDYLCLSSRSLDFFYCSFAELMCLDGNILLQFTISQNLYAILHLAH